MNENQTSSGLNRLLGDLRGEAQPKSAPIAQLIVQLAGQSPQVYDLAATTISVGRDSSNDIALDAPYISRTQFTLMRNISGYRLLPHPDATTYLVQRGDIVQEALTLKRGEFLRLAGSQPGEMATFVYTTLETAPDTPRSSLPFPPESNISIGSAEACDLGTGNPLLDPQQATLARDAHGDITLTHTGDLGITTLNGTPVDDAAQVAPDATVRVGSLYITFSDAALHYEDRSGTVVTARRGRELPDEVITQMVGSGGALVEVRNLNKQVRPDLNLLDDLSLYIRPREFVVLVGLSGAGKSTLMDAIAGYRPATSGEVRVNGIDLYENFDALRNSIGFVPQKDIVHQDLTVYEALDYAARLRLPPETTGEERATRISGVLAELGLSEQRDVLVKSLSGGQLKRVSIGVELITSPPLFFLDEPTSGLDPGTETAMMHLLRNLADSGRTIILITHATKNIMLADKVIFMVRGGRMAWFGPPDAALTYFDAQRSARERRDTPMDFDKIYPLLEQGASPQAWADRYRASNYYQQYVAQPLQRPTPAPSQAKTPQTHPDSIGPLRQFGVLVARNLRLLARDRFTLALLLLAAPLLALMDFITGTRDIYDPTSGDGLRVLVINTTIVINAMLVSALSQMREIIKDRDIYRRERLVNLRIGPYLLSKIAVAALLAIFQALAWTGIRYLAIDMPGGADAALAFYLTMFLTVLAGMMLGLFASAIAPTPDSVALLVAMLIVPQVLFNGALLPYPELNPVGRVILDVMPARYSLEALTTINAHGQSLTRDACWQLPDAERAALTDAQKADCACMGASIFSQCTYPGIRQFYDPAVDVAEPVMPFDPQQALPAVLPRNLVQTTIDDMLAYADEYEAWQTARTGAIVGAEERLKVDWDSYQQVYDVNVANHWLILGLMIVGLSVVIYGIQRTKDVL